MSEIAPLYLPRKGKKNPYWSRNNKFRCNNCNRPLKDNVTKRKPNKPKFCYHCFLSIVKNLKTYKGKLLKNIIASNKKKYR